MGLTDEQLLDFNADRLADFDYDAGWKRIDDLGDVYRAQLVAARWIDGWRRRSLDASGRTFDPEHFSTEWVDGWDAALRDVIAHLRQGDLVPGGTLYNDEVGLD